MQPETKRADKASEVLRSPLQRYRQAKAVAAIRKRKQNGRAPLSYSQRQIWLHSQLAGDALIYNEPITIYRDGELDVAALERAFTEIVRRHEAWRTTFHWNGDEGVQVVHDAPDRVKIPIADLRGHPKAEEEVLRIATEDAHRPFDLAEGPMYRLRVLQLADDEYRLYIALHHIIFDGVSLYRVLMPELLALYQSFSKNESPQLDELPIQYADYAAWQRESMKEIPPDRLSYWENALADLPTVDLKTDRPRPPVQTYAGAMEMFQVSHETSAALKALGQEQHAAPFVVIGAAFMTLLNGWTKQEDIVIGGISGGRERIETLNLLGCFLNTIPIRCAFSKEDPFVDLLSRTRSATLNALSNEVPFELLVQRFGRDRDPSRSPLFQILIVMEPPLEPLPAGWRFAYMDVKSETTKFDLQLGLEDRDGRFAGSFIYNTDLFDRETIEPLKLRWLRLLDQIAAAPAKRIRELVDTVWQETASLPPAEWSGTRTNYPRDLAVHQVFEQQAQRTPNAVAVVFGESQLSYAELNQRANHLARRLQASGVTTGAPVGVWMERSLEMIVALLAVLKAGSAYVPLDPSYPVERLKLMIDDIETPVILTQLKFKEQIAALNQKATMICLDEEDLSMQPVQIFHLRPRRRTLLTSFTLRDRLGCQRELPCLIELLLG